MYTPIINPQYHSGAVRKRRFELTRMESSPPLVLIVKALVFAARKHRHQRRKDAEASPYINHPIVLAAVLCNEAGIGDPVVIATALLHDTVEDTDTSARRAGA